MTSSGNGWSGFQRILGDFTSFLTAKLIVASLLKKLNNLVKSTKTKFTEHSEETEERGL